MAVTDTGAWPQATKSAYATTTAAATINSASPTNTVSLLAIGSNGGEVTRVSVIASETNTLTIAYLYLSKDSGTTKRLIASKEIAAETVSTTAGPTLVDFGFSEDDKLQLEAGDELYVGTSVALTNGFFWLASFRDL